MVLSIAGFDPSGGAGIIADVRTIESFGCTPVAAITSITFQNAAKYFGAVHQPADLVRKQIEAIALDYSISAVKIGMLPTAETVSQVARLIGELNLPGPVLDPVMRSTTGGELMSDDAFELFVTELLPRARVVTPNIPEAEKLSGMNIQGEEQMRQASARIRELGARAVLVKGGHLDNLGSRPTNQGSSSLPSEAVDVLDDDRQVSVFRAGWIDTANVRGTGCMLSSAIAAGLAKDFELVEAVQSAKEFVAAQIQNSKLKATRS